MADNDDCNDLAKRLININYKSETHIFLQYAQNIYNTPGELYNIAVAAAPVAYAVADAVAYAVANARIHTLDLQLDSLDKTSSSEKIAKINTLLLDLCKINHIILWAGIETTNNKQIITFISSNYKTFRIVNESNNSDINKIIVGALSNNTNIIDVFKKSKNDNGDESTILDDIDLLANTLLNPGMAAGVGVVSKVLAHVARTVVAQVARTVVANVAEEAPPPIMFNNLVKAAAGGGKDSGSTAHTESLAKEIFMYNFNKIKRALKQTLANKNRVAPSNNATLNLENVDEKFKLFLKPQNEAAVEIKSLLYDPDHYPYFDYVECAPKFYSDYIIFDKGGDGGIDATVWFKNGRPKKDDPMFVKVDDVVYEVKIPPDNFMTKIFKKVNETYNKNNIYVDRFIEHEDVLKAQLFRYFSRLSYIEIKDVLINKIIQSNNVQSNNVTNINDLLGKDFYAKSKVFTNIFHKYFYKMEKDYEYDDESSEFHNYINTNLLPSLYDNPLVINKGVQTLECWACSVANKYLFNAYQDNYYSSYYTTTTTTKGDKINVPYNKYRTTKEDSIYHIYKFNYDTVKIDMIENGLDVRDIIDLREKTGLTWSADTLLEALESKEFKHDEIPEQPNYPRKQYYTCEVKMMSAHFFCLLARDHKHEYDFTTIPELYKNPFINGDNPETTVSSRRIKLAPYIVVESIGRKVTGYEDFAEVLKAKNPNFMLKAINVIIEPVVHGGRGVGGGISIKKPQIRKRRHKNKTYTINAQSDVIKQILAYNFAVKVMQKYKNKKNKLKKG